jgi:hypothetical protein
MIANWKWLSLAVAVLVAIVGLRPLGDTEPGPAVGDEAVADGSGCAGHRPTPCMIEIRYAYPAGDLSVVPEEMIYF